eukprot:10194545-Ditylum_brightwellii.AAC.1
MAFPCGWEKPGKVLKLTKTVHGLSQAPLRWFNKLSDGLHQAGFKASNFDPCLFLSNHGIELCIEDDAAGVLGLTWSGKTMVPLN